MRGIVLPLTMAQRANRARYLGQLADASVLDTFVRTPAPMCVDGYYLLQGQNGGKDPTAPDPFQRWSKPGSSFVNRTADCEAGRSWCEGHDRYQPDRFKGKAIAGYAGEINCNSSLLDAFSDAPSCFVPCDRPEVGSAITSPTGAVGFEACGHVAVVIEVPLEWDPNELACWAAVKVVDIASRSPKAANRPSTAKAWFASRKEAGAKKFSAFLKSIMVP